jgi:NAD(P)-dependent dehydrogenase (short-subunit alcohol dehydrogenase family)
VIRFEYSKNSQNGYVIRFSGVIRSFFTGIGFYITKLLAEMGCRVVVPSRKGLEYETKSAKDAIIKACPSAKIVISEIPLDLASFSSVREFAQSLKSLEAIDFLCLNAGRGGSKGDPRETTAADGYESIMQVNAVSHFLLTAELMPLLKAAKDGARVVSQSSGARQIWTTGGDVPQRMLNDLSGEKIPADKYDAFTQYELSKAANCFFTMGLNKRLATAGIDNIIALATDPGFSCTGN